MENDGLSAVNFAFAKQALFDKYEINQSHAVWDRGLDSFMSVELFRLMNDRLPDENDTGFKHAIDFLDKIENDKQFFQKVFSNVHFGSLYLTAKRIIYRFADDILKLQSTN